MENDSYEFNVDEKLRPSVERKLTGTTKTDSEIAALSLPDNPLIIRWSILALRIYRLVVPSSIRNRCVFEPSCSHYSEAAIRKYGFFSGIFKTAKRLHRCTPKNGGLDLP
jgi:putative membrane protein insertion efficiency factor|tara:strand:- start:67 stop:396 length:330 start_codon:yes stop_codon:yes gene_type:complete